MQARCWARSACRARIVPRYPGVTSAMGCVIADMRADFVQTVNTLTTTADGAALAALIADHVAQGQAMLGAAGGAFAARVVTVELDMAYVGQTHTVAVPLPVAITGDTVAPPTPQDIAAAFEAAYLRVYSRLLPGGVSRILNLRTAVIGQRPKFDLATLAPTTSGPVTPRTTRRVHMGGAWCDAAIHDRLGPARRHGHPRTRRAGAARHHDPGRAGAARHGRCLSAT